MIKFTDNTGLNYLITKIKNALNLKYDKPDIYSCTLNNDGTINTYSATLTYTTVKSELTSHNVDVYLDVIYRTSRFYVKAIQDMDTNNGPIKFIGEFVNVDGSVLEVIFTLASDDTLTNSISVRENAINRVNSVVSNASNTYTYPNTYAVYNEFQRKPVVVWESNDPSTYLKGLQTNMSATPNWQLTDLDLTPYKRIKIYTCAGKGSTNASTTPAIILEMSLDSRAVSTAWGNNYVASTVIQKSNDNNRLATLTCAVSNDKTSFAVLWQTSLYGTAGTSNNDVNANVFMIEGYYD